MLDPDARQQPEPPAQTEPDPPAQREPDPPAQTEPDQAATSDEAVAPGSAPAPGPTPAPAAPAAEPAADAASAPVLQPYELPSARQVVGSGLGLALASTRELRRASIYIGLLVLGAFGPAAVAGLLLLGRLGDDADRALSSLFGAGLGRPADLALEGVIALVLVDALIGLLLFVSISIDAQVIAIAHLGGRAGERPLRLWEAITRARQTFWRMAGAGTLVGIVSAVIRAVLLAVIGLFSRSPEATEVAALTLTTIVTAPLAYVATSIILGDVGATESLRRSWLLFRARRGLAVVVVLFTLVTSAIQLFALSAGLDLVIRAGELLHVSLTEGALAFLAATVLILAVIVAYGSLTFTIGAIVSAPQVSGFLGLTFYAAGIDRARGDGPRPPRGFHYVTRPMLLAMLGLAALVAVQIPTITGVTASPGSGTLNLLDDAALDESETLVVFGYPALVEDPPGDVPNGATSAPETGDLDLVQAEAAILDEVPDWVLARFDCAASNVACRSSQPDAWAFNDGALLFMHRVAEDVPPDLARTFAVVLELHGSSRLRGERSPHPFNDATHLVLATVGPSPRVGLYYAADTTFRARGSHARAMWSGREVFTILPFSDLFDEPLAWDLAVFAGEVDPGTARPPGDSLRPNPAQPLRAFDWDAQLYFSDFGE